MGTKSAPGVFDCYAKAEADEPLFTLLARDPQAPVLVRLWADWRATLGEDPAVVAEARSCAEAMRRWRAALRQAQGEGDLSAEASAKADGFNPHGSGPDPVGLRAAEEEMA